MHLVLIVTFETDVSRKREWKSVALRHWLSRERCARCAYGRQARVSTSTRNRIRTATYPRVCRASHPRRRIDFRISRSRKSYHGVGERGRGANRRRCAHATIPRHAFGMRSRSVRNSTLPPLTRPIRRAIHVTREIYGNDIVKSRPRARRSTRGGSFLSRQSTERNNVLPFTIAGFQCDGHVAILPRFTIAAKNERANTYPSNWILSSILEFTFYCLQTFLFIHGSSDRFILSPL